MKGKIALTTLIVSAFLLLPAAGAEVLVVPAPHPADTLGCENYSTAEIADAHGVMTETFVEPSDPTLTLTVHLLCALDASAEDPLTTLTDCTATAWSHTGWKWNAPYIARVDTTNSYGFTSTQVVNTFSVSSEAWDVEVAADIFGAFTAGGSSSNIRKLDGFNQHGWKNLGGGGTIAVTYTWASGSNAVESDAAYNTFFAWSLTGEANKMDLQNVATHELGHTFGMGHTSTASANSCLTMYPSGAYGETAKRTLGDGDILGIQARYP